MEPCLPAIPMTHVPGAQDEQLILACTIRLEATASPPVSAMEQRAS